MKSIKRIATLAGLLVLVRPSVLEDADRRVYDALARTVPAVEEVAPVLIVAVDEASLGALGQWPWPRETLARLVTRLSLSPPGPGRLRDVGPREGAPVSTWVIAAIIVNAALVVAVIVLALHIANRSAFDAIRAQRERRIASTAVVRPPLDERPTCVD